MIFPNETMNTFIYILAGLGLLSFLVCAVLGCAAVLSRNAASKLTKRGIER